MPLLSTIRATYPAHLILLHLFSRTILGEQYRSLSFSLCSFLHSPVTSSLLGPNFVLNTLFSNTLSLLSSLSVGDRISPPLMKNSYRLHKNPIRNSCLCRISNPLLCFYSIFSSHLSLNIQTVSSLKFCMNSLPLFLAQSVLCPAHLIPLDLVVQKFTKPLAKQTASLYCFHYPHQHLVVTLPMFFLYGERTRFIYCSHSFYIFNVFRHEGRKYTVN